MKLKNYMEIKKEAHYSKSYFYSSSVISLDLNSG